MDSVNTAAFSKQRGSLLRRMTENSMKHMISMISLEGTLIYHTPIVSKQATCNTEPQYLANEGERIFWQNLIQSERVFHQAVKNPGVPFIHQISFQKNDGTYACYESSFTNMIDINFINRILVVDRDVTTDKLSQKDPIEEEDQFRLLVEGMKNHAMCMIDAGGCVLTWNQATERMLGYSEDEIIGEHFSAFYTEVDKINSLPVKQLDTTKERGRSESSSWRMRKNGSLFFADEVYVALFNDDNELRGYVYIIHDSTERRQLAEQILVAHKEFEEKRMHHHATLELANKELESFSYSVSHDLGAPLRALRNYSIILKEDHGNLFNEKGDRYLHKIISNTDRMHELINGLIAFYKIGKTEISNGAINMEFLVNSAIEQLLPENIKEKYEIVVHPLPSCYGDRGMMKQVWINLIDNAIKFSNKRSVTKIEIGHREDERMDVYFIQDNGVGFDMRYSGKLFGVFQRLHHQDLYEGTGMGLALSQRIIHKHSGEISAKASPDNGSLFTFKLPKFNYYKNETR